MKNKLGLSTVVATLLLVLLTIALVAIVWGVINNLVQNQLPEQGCLDVFEKLKFNSAYTCYNASTSEMLISISTEDINISQAVIAISYQGSSKSLQISSQNSQITNLKPYNGNYGDSVKLPDRNSGATYVYNLTAGGFNGRPESVKIVPVIGKQQCSVSDSLDQIDNCP